jgi:soluble lytic murein transglycosylase-like protein
MLTGTASLMAAESTPPVPAERVTTVVRADRHTGKLIRSVVVTPVVVLPVDPSAKSPAQNMARTPARLPDGAALKDIIEKAALDFDVDPLLVHAVIKAESNYNPYAISPKGAEGLMQLMPATARHYGVTNSFNAEDNIRAGVKHLKELKDTFKDDRLAIAAYNAGAGAVNKYKWIPPYPETQDYVYKVGKNYGDARRAAVASVAAQKASAPPSPPQDPPAPEHRPVESFIDAEGRLHMRTK